MNFTRRETLNHLGAIGGLVALLKSGSAATPNAVTQRELAEIIALHNRAEVLAANIHRRIEAGAPIERGRLTVSNGMGEPLKWYEEAGIGVSDSLRGLAGIDIYPSVGAGA